MILGVFFAPCHSIACKGECHCLQLPFFSVVYGKNDVFTLAVNIYRSGFLFCKININLEENDLLVTMISLGSQ
jgi:hypothetical protein